MDVDFFSDPDGPTGTSHEPSVAMRADKEHFGSSRRARWFDVSQMNAATPEVSFRRSPE